MEFALARWPIGLPLIEFGILGVLSIGWLGGFRYLNSTKFPILTPLRSFQRLLHRPLEVRPYAMRSHLGRLLPGEGVVQRRPRSQSLCLDRFRNL